MLCTKPILSEDFFFVGWLPGIFNYLLDDIFDVTHKVSLMVPVSRLQDVFFDLCYYGAGQVIAITRMVHVRRFRALQFVDSRHLRS